MKNTLIYTPNDTISKSYAVILMALGYFILAKASFLFSIPPGNISPVFPAAGFALALTYAYGYHLLIGIYIGSFLSNTTSILFFSENNNPLIMDIVVSGAFVALGVTLATIIGVHTIKILNKNANPLNSTGKVLAFITGCLLSSLLSAYIGCLSLTHVLSQDWNTFELKFITWWRGDFAGAIITGAFIFSWLYKDPTHNKIKSITKKNIFLLLLVFISLNIYSDDIELKYLLLLTMVLCFSFFIGLRGVTTFTTFYLIIASILTNLGNGPFVMYDKNDSMLFLNTLLIINTIIGLLIAALLLEEKEKREKFFGRLHEKN